MNRRVAGPSEMSGSFRLFGELKRRNVFRVRLICSGAAR